MQKAQAIIKKYVESDNFENLMNELKENNIYFSNEDNLDIRYGKQKSRQLQGYLVIRQKAKKLLVELLPRLVKIKLELLI